MTSKSLKRLLSLISSLLLVLLILLPRVAVGQLVVDQTLTPVELVQQVLIGSGVTVTDVTYNGDLSQGIGSFLNGNTTNLGLSEGVILTSGDIAQIPGNCNNSISETHNPDLGDPDLAALIGITSNDINNAAILEFDFIPQSDTLSFRYVFGSEEYNDYVCSEWNDVFGFFISGPGINGPFTNNAENIAIVPESAPPLPVAINSINNGSPGNGQSAANCISLDYAHLFVDNCSGSGIGPATTIAFNGFTVVLTAQFVVQACTTYHIKLAIGDAWDHIFNSGVFLEANSFSATGLTINTEFSASGSSYASLIEGCNDVTINFELAEIQSAPYVIDIDVTGTATNGVDYSNVPSLITIPQGDLTGSLFIEALQDNTIESTETIKLAFSYESVCSSQQDTIDLVILDNSIDFGGLETSYNCGETIPDTLWGHPSTGVYSGPGMVDSLFYPSLADPGLNQIFFTNYFIDHTGAEPDTVCTSQLMMETTVSSTTEADAGSDETICSSTAFDFSTSAILPSVSANDSIKWIGGTGTFSDPNIIYPLYYPGTNESGNVQMGLICYGTPPCGNDTSYMTLTIGDTPNVSFNITPNDTICVNETVTFTGINNDGNIVQNWQWDFGDGGSANSQTATHTYTNAYDDNVRLIAISDLNCSDTVYSPITVMDPDIDFTFTPDPACVGATITFTGIGDVDFADWDWDFGDGNTETGQNTTHLYATDGTYDVSLSVCSKTVNDQVTINPGAFCNAGSNELYCADTPYDFAASTTLPTASDYESILWYGGAGSFSDPYVEVPVYNPAAGETGTIDIFMIAYGLPPCGNYTSAMTLTIGITPEPVFTFTPDNSICINDAISFSGSNNNNATITNWNWNFGDGNLSTQQNPNHTYGSNGVFNVELSLTTTNGCTESTSQQITISEPPNASMVISPNNTTCVEAILDFSGTDNNGTNITNWDWDFGDGNTAISQNTNHAYLTDGTYEVKLYITNNNDCFDSVINTVTVSSLPQSDFTISPNDTTCMGELINLDASDISGDIVSWDWQFGDANTATGQNVTHTYNQSGNFNILSIYTATNGCVDTTAYQRNVQDVDIGFDITQSPSCQDYTVNFTGTGDLVTFTDWNWDFGDGSQADLGHNVSHIYTVPDIVDVVLNVCSEQSVQQLIINGTCDVDAGSDEFTCQDVYFDLTESATPPSAGNFSSIYWYSDGLGTIDDPTLIAPTYFPDPVEGAIQNDTIIMTMVGYAIAPCENDTSTMMLIVIPGAYAQAGSDENSCFGNPFDFANSTDSSFATNYTSLYWLTSGTGSFIDPNISRPIYVPGSNEIGPITLTMVASNVINCDSIDEMILTIRPTYEMPVNFTICHYDSIFAQRNWQYSSGIFYDTLPTVGYGCDSVIVTTLTVRPKIDQDFFISSSDSICNGETVSFESTGSATLTSRYWDFGDGIISTTNNPTHQYDSSGYFTVIYHYTDDNGCSDSATREVTVFELPDVSFTTSTSNACVNVPIDFFGSSNSSIISWQWDFGDGQTGDEQNISHTYTTWGNITVSLTVTDVAGCNETYYNFLTIAPSPVANFTYDIIICDSIQFTDLSTKPDGYNIVTWTWDFGDGTTSDLQNPTHQYPHTTTPGGEIYDVELTVVADSNGFMCSGTIVLPVTVPELPDIFYTFDPDPTCLGDTTHFYGESGYIINSWHWDFGDGDFATSQDADHLYANTGSYDVLLSIIDNNGCANSLSNVIIVNPITDVSFTMSDSITCQGNTISFTGIGNNIDTWYWEFGDGSFSNDQNPIHYYSSGGTYTITLTINDTTGCSNSTTDEILILPGPTADYSYANVTCSSVVFTDLSSAPAGYNLVEWYWDFDDGFYSNVQNPSHSFAGGNGIYDVMLVVTADSSGYSCSDTIIQTVNTPGLPTVFFTWNPEPTFLGDITNFFGASGNTVVDWYWDFGDGNSAITQDATHTYATIGTFDVELTIADIDGCVNSVIHQVTVTSIPVLDFTWDFGCEGDPVQFTVLDPPTDIAAVVSWSWEFGDGGTSTVMDPLHVYAVASSYDVSLTIIDTMGAVNTLTKSITINPIPIAIFSIEAPTCSGNPVQFHNHSTSPTGYIVEWHWDFGDGNSTTVTSPDNPDVSYTYANAGTYVVMLTVKNSDSCSNSSTNTVTTTPSPIALFSHSGSCTNTLVSFTDESVENGGSSIISWDWDFGDPNSGPDNISSLQNPDHIFIGQMPVDGYPVRLIVSNAQGCSDTILIDVIVYETVDIDFSAEDEPFCIEEVIQFTSTGVDIVSWDWNFGDGGSSNLENPTYAYFNAGSYTVSLLVTNIDGCEGYVEHDIIINEDPFAAFSTSSPACMGAPIEFLNYSTSPTGYITQWVWDFGDGNDTTINFPDNPNVSHIYELANTYTATLTVTNSNECNSSITHEVVITQSPIAAFDYSGTCTDSPVSFTDLSQENGGGVITSWSWNFDDPGSGVNNTSNLQNPIHIYGTPGSYFVDLIIENANGCTDTILDQEVIITDSLVVEILVDPDTVCLNEPISFEAIATDAIIWLWNFGDGSTANIWNPTHTYTETGTFVVTLYAETEDGCSGYAEYNIVVNEDPIAVFSTDSPNCIGSPTNFYNESSSPTGYIVEWIWSFGDGTDVTVLWPDNPDVSHVYNMGGTYNATLSITNSNGCSSSTSNEVVIAPGPIAAFDYNGSCAESPISFIDLSQENGGGEIVSWSWDFGDPASGTNNTSDLQNPVHSFTVPGTFTVQLIIENIAGCTDTISNQNIIITDALAVEIQSDNDTVCLDVLINFEAIAADAVIWLWDFGDGNTANTQITTNTYTEAGDFVVTLYVEDASGCSNTDELLIVVRPNPVSLFNSSAPICSGDSVYFTNLSSTPNGFITTWIWDMGDGSPLIQIDNPDDPNIAYKYDNPETYEVILTVIDNAGCENISSKLIQVTTSPIAEFTWDNSCFNTPVLFTDLSNTNGGPDLYSWQWYFGDPLSGINNSSDLQNPSHIFIGEMPIDGYIVTLIVTNTLGCDSTITHNVIVDEVPDVSFTMSSDTLCLNETIQFSGESTSEISDWFWEFGDGGTSIDQNTVYIYSAPGTYTVTLTVTGLNGCTATATDFITIKDAPIANFSYANACLGDTTYFVDDSYSALGYINEWQWDFGDGTPIVTIIYPDDPNVKHAYTSSNDYLVKLITIDNYGCTDTITQWVQVRTTPIAGMSYVQSCDPAGLVNFFDESEPGGDGSPIQTWMWDFDDGNYSNEIDPEYIFADTDSCYQVILTVTDANGCYNTDTVEVCLFGTLEVEFSSTEECFGIPTFFTTEYSPDNDSIASYTWNFNDGTPNEVTYHDTISHVFPHSGIFIVELVALDTNGCSASTYGEVIVDSLPTAQFTNTIGSCDTPTQFTDESLGGGEFIESWFWDFGDVISGADNTSILENPTHLYGPYDSTYQVKLVITNFNGCVDSVMQEVYVEPCLIAEFELPSGLTCARYELCFTDLSMLSSNNGIITQWRWDFGDGVTYNYGVYQESICHTYEDGGNYDVQLIVHAIINEITYSDTVINVFTVNATPIAGMIVEANCLGDSTRFYDDTNTNGEPLTMWHWDFGDNSNPNDTSIVQNPTYLYPGFGTYNTELKVMNQYGCRDSITEAVEIFKPPLAEFSFEETCMSYYTFFTDESIADSSDIVLYQWDFGDTLVLGDTSAVQHPEYIYDSTGHYLVQLTVTDGNMCVDSINHNLEIYPIPTANFIIMDTVQQGQIYLDNTSIESSYYYWDFDFDYGVSSTEEYPTHQYEEDGTYNIMLVSYNEYGCPDTTYQQYQLLFTNLFVPNAFVPSNSNAELRVFKPVGINLRSYRLEVYSAWGNLVFQSTKLEDGTPAEGWDGTYEGKLLPTGSFIWRISAVFENGEHWKGSDNGDGNTETNGTVTLIR